MFIFFCQLTVNRSEDNDFPNQLQTFLFLSGFFALFRRGWAVSLQKLWVTLRISGLLFLPFARFRQDEARTPLPEWPLMASVRLHRAISSCVASLSLSECAVGHITWLHLGEKNDYSPSRRILGWFFRKNSVFLLSGGFRGCFFRRLAVFTSCRRDWGLIFRFSLVSAK